MSEFAFERPWVLWLIILVILCFIKCRAKESALLFPHLSILKKAADKKSFLPEFLKAVAIFGLIFSLAGPMAIDKSVELKKKGYDIVLALDASGSMREKGFDENNPFKTKFEVVKELVKDFIKKRVNDNIGVVIFGSFSYIASPLSFNKDVVNKILDYLDIGIAGQKTAISDALIESISMLKDSKAKSKVIILLTDGIDTASKTPISVAMKMAKKYHIKIYTIGIGQRRGIDERLLSWIAEESGGEYFFARTAKDLHKVYATIDKLEKSEIRGKEFVKKAELYPYVLFVAILALLGYIYIYSKRGF
ncbi:MULTISPECIES: VWA domain-containing protein [unclassified Nitratiruptor]|uniref:vWA domain-containing protein n=1 Tax=unclassified Nitratiruptor TaxID=2624044 RepID=UPI001914FABD|nr:MULTISPECIES: VWA domain-containing protein [unclassified Nitratiruptor]